MDENIRIEEQMEQVLRQKIDEFDSIDLTGEGAKDSAEALAKVTDAYVRLESEKRSKKENFFKILGIAGGFLATIGAAFLKCLSDQKIAEQQLDYFRDEHDKAYEFETTGKTEHLVTSPTARDILRDRPKLK